LPTAEILSQGHEVVTGQVADTNAAWLSEHLVDLGFDVQRHTSVGDRLADLVQLLREVAGRSDVCICTGGLGPTEDDLTAQAVAKAFDTPLAFDPVAMAHIEALYTRFRRTMPEVNRKQAWLPTGAERLDNDWGTAPGFAVAADGAWMAFLPGVPREMHQMWEHRVRPRLEHRYDLNPGTLVTLRTTGVGESNLQERLGTVEEAEVSFRTKLPENHIKLLFAPQMTALQRADVVVSVAQRIGSPLFSIEGAPEVAGRVPHGLDLVGGNLAEVVARTLADSGQTLAVAESCTGGRVASSCTAIPGASSWFLEGVVTYSNAAKMRLLGVDPAAIEAHGAVSEAVVCQMAEGVRQAAGATWGLATSGIAGPGGGTGEKPVGTVHIALAGPNSSTHRALHLAGNRDRIQSLSAAAVLDLLRRTLSNA
jgi:competence/damage-inducible protein CinA-like protein